MSTRYELTIEQCDAVGRAKAWAWRIKFACGDEDQGGSGRTGGHADNLTQALSNAGETVLTLQDALTPLDEDET